MTRPARTVHPVVAEVTARVAERSRPHRTAYLAKIDAAAGNMAQLVNENRKPIRQFTDTGLVELSQMIKEVRTLTTSLNIIAGKLERDPAGYIFSGKQGYTPK